ncbi:hypothetical protein [Nonomuraea sp. KM88]|uniref:hypothetical protein n=1 Tax=Nonomuraea sp. KM88 TaxID=3457427 RepID=UPI003FCE5091
MSLTSGGSTITWCVTYLPDIAGQVRTLHGVAYLPDMAGQVRNHLALRDATRERAH